MILRTCITMVAVSSLLVGCERTTVEPLSLMDAPSPVKPVELGRQTSALTSSDPLCDPSVQCGGCNVNADVGHILFVHGYSSDSGAFSAWHRWIKAQNDCAGYNTYRVTIGNIAAKEMKHYPNGCYFWACEDRYVQRQCTPNAYDPQCIGQCNSWYSNSSSNHPAGECNGWDRSKNGICGGNGYCIAADSDYGARKHLDVWSSDLAHFFWNNKLTDLPDRSITVVTHSTGAPAFADFMVRGYDNAGNYGIPARKIKRVVNIQAALGGACGVSAAFNKDDAVSDLDDLQDDDLNFDFRKTTFDGSVPWLHVQSRGSESKECEGSNMWLDYSTGETCGGTTHDGVTNNYSDNTSVRHPNGNGTEGTTNGYNVTVRAAETGYCHVNDEWPSYRASYDRFIRVLGRPLTNIGDVMNPAAPMPAWWPVVLLGENAP